MQNVRFVTLRPKTKVFVPDRIMTTRILLVIVFFHGGFSRDALPERIP
jgi:hypothetical protein